MSKVVNRLRVQAMPWHANMTELNHLGKALLTKPEKIQPKITQLFTSYRYSDNPLTKRLSGLHERTLNTQEWEWELKGASTRPLICIERMESASNTTVGKFKQQFRLKLDEDWYIPGDIISPGSSDKRIQARVQQQPLKHGQGFIYTCELMTEDQQLFVPERFMEAGVPWTKLYSQYEEGAEQSGSTQFSAPLSLRSRMSRLRKHYRITGDAAQEVLGVSIQTPEGRWVDSWIKYAEAEYWSQWYREREIMYWYSRSTETVKGGTGRAVRTGPGIQEYLEDSHVHRYSVLTARLIEEYLMDIFYGRVRPGAGRKIEGYTGEYGMIQFHRAIDAWSANRPGFIRVVDSNFIGKDNSEYSSNALTAGYQFTRYVMANGAELKLIHNPLYDDRNLNSEIDPISGYPMESQRITFLDFSNGEGGSNIELVKRKNSFKSGYVCGLQSPYGPTNNGPMAHTGDYYEVHMQEQIGVHMTDATRCGELILSRN